MKNTAWANTYDNSFAGRAEQRARAQHSALMGFVAVDAANDYGFKPATPSPSF